MTGILLLCQSINYNLRCTPVASDKGLVLPPDRASLGAGRREGLRLFPDSVLSPCHKKVEILIRSAEINYNKNREPEEREDIQSMVQLISGLSFQRNLVNFY